MSRPARQDGAPHDRHGDWPWSRSLAADVDRDALVELGLKYLRDADALEPAAVAAAAEPA